MSSNGSRAQMIRKLKCGLYRSLLLAALLAELCQAGQAQEAPGAAPSTTFTGGAVTLFQDVRIFDGKGAALSAPSNVLRVGDIRVFYAVLAETVQVLAIVPKSEATIWLEQFGKPE